MSFKEIFVNFNISFISIFLGMLCTFAGQGMIDRAADRKEVRTALELVRSELAANIEDIGIMSDYMVQERKSAEYFLENRALLRKCPADSIEYHSSIIFADASITLSHDALELLKMSSLFQKIGSSDLSMKIIRAYDTCESTVANLNRHIAARDSRFDSSVNDRTAAQFASTGSIDIRKYVQTPYGLYTIRWIATQPSPEHFTDVTDVRKAIDAIDTYLQGKRHRK